MLVASWESLSSNKLISRKRLRYTINTFTKDWANTNPCIMLFFYCASVSVVPIHQIFSNLGILMINSFRSPQPNISPENKP